MSNSLGPDQARHSVFHSVGPDLGPNCLQKLSADDTRTGIFLAFLGRGPRAFHFGNFSSF